MTALLVAAVGGCGSDSYDRKSVEACLRAKGYQPHEVALGQSAYVGGTAASGIVTISRDRTRVALAFDADARAAADRAARFTPAKGSVGDVAVTRGNVGYWAVRGPAGGVWPTATASAARDRAFADITACLTN